MEIMKKLIKEMGFNSEKEFHHLVANTDLSTPLKLSAFTNWQENDGSKEGLLKLQIKE